MNSDSTTNSYRGFSKTLLINWLSYFEARDPADMMFLEQNAYRCLRDFEEFAPDFETRAKAVAVKVRENVQIDEASYEKWLDEKISKALDIYWAPLSQALTQYTSPAYKEYLENLLKNEDLKLKMETYLTKMNELIGRSGDERITTDDILLFFDEHTLIRRPPFTKLALISTPFRVFDNASASIDSKLTGIAHELGHYLYWRIADFNHIGTTQKELVENICKSLQAKGHEEGNIRFVRSWIEEMFADFVGTKVAGQAFVKSSQEMVIRKNKTFQSLGENDNEHAPDVLRPLISMYTFSKDQAAEQDTAGLQGRVIEAWKSFFKEAFCADLSKIFIWNIRARKNERTIKRTPEQLSKIFLDTVDMFFGLLGAEDRKSFFQPSVLPVMDASQLVDKAETILRRTKRKVSEKDPKILELLLNPVVLEAEEQPHSHPVTVVGPSNHGGATLTLSHSHPPQ